MDELPPPENVYSLGASHAPTRKYRGLETSGSLQDFMEKINELAAEGWQLLFFETHQAVHHTAVLELEIY